METIVRECHYLMPFVLLPLPLLLTSQRMTLLHHALNKIYHVTVDLYSIWAGGLNSSATAKQIWLQGTLAVGVGDQLSLPCHSVSPTGMPLVGF